MTTAPKITLKESIVALMATICNAVSKMTEVDNGPYQIGKAYQIRTVTFSYVGVIKEIHRSEIVLTKVAWIADLGRFTQACETGDYEEVEMFKEGAPVIIRRELIVDATDAPNINLRQKPPIN